MSVSWLLIPTTSTWKLYDLSCLELGGRRDPSEPWIEATTLGILLGKIETGERALWQGSFCLPSWLQRTMFWSVLFTKQFSQ